MLGEFTVRTCKHGIAVIGNAPLMILSGILTQCESEGFTVIAMDIAEKIGANLVITTTAGHAAWRKELSLADDQPCWLTQSGDTGISSKTIYAVMTWDGTRPAGAVPGSATGEGVIRINQMCEPLDPSDFGRCYRLLKRFPEWRARLSEVADKCPGFAPMVPEWDRMTAMFEEEAKRSDGMAPRLYNLMCELRKV